MRQNNFFNKLNLINLIFICFMSCSAFAACNPEDEDDYYGNAQTCPFQNAVEGTEILSPREVEYLNAIEQTRTIDRTYVSFFVGKPKIKIEGVATSTSATLEGVDVSNLSPTNINPQDTLYTLLLEFGHIWQQWGIEGELFITKKLNFSEAPLYQAVPTVNADIEVQQLALFFNVQYIIPRWFSWYPRGLQVHLDAGAGPAVKFASLNTTNLDGSPRQSSSNRTITGAGNLGVGARYQVTSSILIDIIYRFYSLGKTTMGPIEGVQLQSTKSSAQGLFFGGRYQF